MAKVEIEKFIGDINEDSLIVFTDGSVKGECCYGEGGCGVVVYKKGEESERKIKSYKVGKVVENVQCEVEGIVKALEISSSICETRKSINKCYIFTDCKSAIDIVCKQKNVSKYWDEFAAMWKYMKKLEDAQIELKVVWVPGHAGIQMNDEADSAAKAGTEIAEENTQEGEVDQITSNAVIHWIKNKIKTEWERMWGRSETGEWTRSLGLGVAEKRKIPRKRDLGISYVRAVINNTALADNMYRYKLVDDANCQCGKGRETVEHVLLECELEEEARKEFKEKVGEIWMNKKCDGGLNMDTKLILAPFTISKLSSREADEILDLAFVFISKLSMKF